MEQQLIWPDPVPCLPVNPVQGIRRCVRAWRGRNVRPPLRLRPRRSGRRRRQRQRGTDATTTTSTCSCRCSCSGSGASPRRPAPRHRPPRLERLPRGPRVGAAPPGGIRSSAGAIMTNERAHREELEAVLAALERAAEHYPPGTARTTRSCAPPTPRATSADATAAPT